MIENLRFQAASLQCDMKNSICLKYKIVCNIINVFTVTFDQFNVSLQNQSINFFKKITDPKLLNDKIKGKL